MQEALRVVMSFVGVCAGSIAFAAAIEAARRLTKQQLAAINTERKMADPVKDDPQPAPAPPEPDTDPGVVAAVVNLVNAGKVAVEDGKLVVKDAAILISKASSIGWTWSKVAKYAVAVLTALGVIGGGGTVMYSAMRADPPPNVDPTPQPAPPWGDFARALNGMQADVEADRVESKAARIEAKADRKAILDVLSKPNPIPPIPPGPNPVPVIPQTMLPLTMDAKPGEPSFLVAKVNVSDKFRWVIPPNIPAIVKDYGPELVIVPKQGASDFSVGLVSGASGMPVEWCLVKCGLGPQPPPPVPPTPPDPPQPPPNPAPIPLAGFRVMIMYDPTTLAPAQEGIVFGKKVRDYLQAKCVVGADGKTKDFRIYQTGLDTSAEVQWINNVIQRHPGQKSWMVVSDGKTGYDGPLPASADEALSILTKIGGQ